MRRRILLDVRLDTQLALAPGGRGRPPRGAGAWGVLVLLLVHEKCSRLGSVGRHRAVSHRPVIVGNLVSLLGRVVAVRLVVLRAVVAYGQISVALQRQSGRTELRRGGVKNVLNDIP